MNVKEAAERLEYLCENIPSLLENISEEDFSIRPSPLKWSKKEILGHLIDSAANNQQRFVRVQFEDVPFIKYDQDNWNKFSYHQKINGKTVIEFWKEHNKYLAEIIKNIPEELLNRECDWGGEKNVSLEYLIIDYVAHQEYHLKQIVIY